MKKIISVFKTDHYSVIKLVIVLFIGLLPVIFKLLNLAVGSGKFNLFLFEIYYLPIAILLPFIFDEILSFTFKNIDLRSSFTKWFIFTIIFVIILIAAYMVVDKSTACTWKDHRLYIGIAGVIVSILFILVRFSIKDTSGLEDDMNSEIPEKVHEDVLKDESIFGDYEK